MKGVLFSIVPQLSIQLVSFLLHDSFWMYEVNGQGLWNQLLQAVYNTLAAASSKSRGSGLGARVSILGSLVTSVTVIYHMSTHFI